MSVPILAFVSTTGAAAAAVVATALAWRGRPRLAACLLAVYLSGLAWFLALPILAVAGVSSPAAALLVYNVVGNCALAAFVVAYGRPAIAAPYRWRLVWAATPAAFVLGAAALAPSTFFAPDSTPTPAGVNLARFLHNFAALVGIAIFGAAFLAAPAGPTRRSLLFVLIAFCGFGLNHVFADAARVAGVETAFGSASPPALVISAANAVAVVVVAALATARAARGDRDARILVPALVAVGGLASLQHVVPTAAFGLHQALDTAIVGVLAYGVARGYVLDIDLRLKWTIRRGALVGAFLAVFFVAAAVAEQYLSRYGALVGGVAVGLLLFALRPIERAADRFADRAMPRVRDTAEYRTVRKREVYRATIDGALADGDLSDRERDMLARLQDQLGLSGTEAREIEREAVATLRAS